MQIRNCSFLCKLGFFHGCFSSAVGLLKFQQVYSRSVSFYRIDYFWLFVRQQIANITVFQYH